MMHVCCSTVMTEYHACLMQLPGHPLDGPYIVVSLEESQEERESLIHTALWNMQQDVNKGIKKIKRLIDVKKE